MDSVRVSIFSEFAQARPATIPDSLPPAHFRLPQANAAARGSALPAALAFLPSHGVAPAPLLAALEIAAREGVRPEQALLAHGLLSANAYYRALARHLGLAFVTGPDIGPAHDSLQDRWAEAITAGMMPGTGEDGEAIRWLLAPRGARIDELLTLHRSGRLERKRFAITPPDDLREYIFRTTGASIANAAAMDLPQSQPLASAHGMRLRPGFAFVLTAVMLCSLFYAAGVLWLALSLASGVLLASAIVIRLFAAAASCDARAQPAPVLRDCDLPVYTVIAAIYREAGVVQQLTDALKALDYPALGSKLTLPFMHKLSTSYPHRLWKTFRHNITISWA